MIIVSRAANVALSFFSLSCSATTSSFSATPRSRRVSSSNLTRPSRLSSAALKFVIHIAPPLLPIPTLPLPLTPALPAAFEVVDRLLLGDVMVEMGVDVVGVDVGVREVPRRRSRSAYSRRSASLALVCAQRHTSEYWGFVCTCVHVYARRCVRICTWARTHSTCVFLSTVDMQTER